VLLAALFIVVAGLNIWQYSVRLRVRRILQVVRALDEKRAPDQEVRRAMKQIGGNATPECRKEKCGYEIALNHYAAGSRAARMFWRLMETPARVIFDDVGFRPVMLRGSITVRDGQAYTSSVGLWVGYAPTLIAGNRKSASFRLFRNDPSFQIQPDYHERRPHLTTPGGGEVIDVQITSDATAVERESAWNFNLACITQWGGCSSAGQLMPGAAAMEKYFPYSEDYKFRGCSVKHMARDSQVVALATVKSVGHYRGAWDERGRQNVHYRFDEFIRNDSQTKADIRILGHLVIRGSQSANPFEPGLSGELFKPGRQLVLFITSANIDPDCGIMPADPEVLQHVRAEVARVRGLP